MNFSDFIGNKRIISTFRHALQNNRITNGYIFSGPEGIGKRFLAEIIASALLCKQGGEQPCGQCASCHKLAESKEGDGFHPDLHILEPEGKFIKVEQMRKQLIAKTQLNPHESKNQIFIVDPAEAMHPSAANAFLKTLEEAPGKSIFFLISGNSSSLLPTIKSRCQEFGFQRVGTDELRDELVARLGVSPDKAEMLASMSRGAPGRALGLNLEEYIEERQLGLEFIRAALAEGTIDDIFKLSAKLSKEKESFPQRLDLILTLLRDIMLLASAGASKNIINLDIEDELLNLARGKSPRQLAKLISDISAMQEPLKRNVRIDTVSEHVILGGRSMFKKRR
jgi:DNA polymerase-3 subunit delta'